MSISAHYLGKRDGTYVWDLRAKGKWIGQVRVDLASDQFHLLLPKNEPDIFRLKQLITLPHIHAWIRSSHTQMNVPQQGALDTDNAPSDELT